MDERSFVTILRQNRISLHEGSLDQKRLNFSRALSIVIPPRSVSDRTAFRRIASWLQAGCAEGSFSEDAIFRQVLDYALESSRPECRNPAAVFMSICRKELGYDPRNQSVT
jgi:hypothetical protein